MLTLQVPLVVVFGQTSSSEGTEQGPYPGSKFLGTGIESTVDEGEVILDKLRHRLAGLGGVPFGRSDQRVIES